MDNYIRGMYYYKESSELERYYKIIKIYDLYLKKNNLDLIKFMDLSNLSVQFILGVRFENLLTIIILFFYLDLILDRLFFINKIIDKVDEKINENLFFVFLNKNENIWFFLNSFLKYINWFFFKFNLIKFFSFSVNRLIFNFNFLNFFVKKCYLYNYFFFKFIFGLVEIEKSNENLKNILFFSSLGFKLDNLNNIE